VLKRTNEGSFIIVKPEYQTSIIILYRKLLLNTLLIKYVMLDVMRAWMA